MVTMELQCVCEESPLAPTEVYAESKAEAEQLFYGKLDKHAILRLAAFYVQICALV